MNEDTYHLYHDDRRVVRVSHAHDATTPYGDIADLTSLPAHQTSAHTLSNVEPDVTMQPDDTQLDARTNYWNIKPDDYTCPLLRQSIRSKTLRMPHSYDVQEKHWIYHPREEPDERIHYSTPAYYHVTAYLPQWAQEKAVNRVGLDGHAQWAAYRLIQLERTHNEDYSDEQVYELVVNRHNLKFTVEELAYLDDLVPTFLDDLREEALKLRAEWALVLGGDMDYTEASWCNKDNIKNSAVDGPYEALDSFEEAVEWIYNLHDRFNAAWSEEAEPQQPNPFLEPDEPNNPSTPALPDLAADGGVDPVVYREWKQGDGIPPLTLYCSSCGTQLWEDNGVHAYDHRLRLRCPACETTNTVHTLLSVPTQHAPHSLSRDVREDSLVTYWNRAMRYGFRLGDRIAIDARAAEFKQYAESFGIDWEVYCPMFRLPLDEMDNEGAQHEATDVGVTHAEFNHTQYVDELEHSMEQMAKGFTASRSAHDIVHNNVQQWYLERNILSDLPVDWLEYQAYEVIRVEQPVYNAIYDSNTGPTTEQLLDHVQTYYGFVDKSTGWLRQAYNNVEKHLEQIQAVFEEERDSYTYIYSGMNDKGLETQADVEQFLTAKEQRNKEYVADLKHRAETGSLQHRRGDDIGLVHPVVKAYQHG